MINVLESIFQAPPLKKALVDNNKNVSYGELTELIKGLEKEFRATHIQAEDTAALLISGGVHWLSTSLALEKMNVLQVLIPFHSTLYETRHFLKATKPRFLIVEKNISFIEDLKKDYVLVYDNNDLSVLKRVNDDTPKRLGGFVVFTSGVTNKSKAVHLSYQNVLQNICDSLSFFKEGEFNETLGTQPFYHVSSLRLVRTVFYLNKTMHALAAPVIPDIVNRYADEHRLTYLSSTPLILNSMLERGAFSKETPMNSLRVITVGGNSTPQSLKEKLKNAAPDISLYVLYGLSECTSLVSVLPPERCMIKNGLGDRLGSFHFKIAESGELLLRGPSVMLGYLDEQSDKKDEWFPTGDMVELINGELIFKGRIKEVFIRGGKNISPLEIEDAIRESEHVLNAAVVGLDEGLVDDIKIVAFVILKEHDALNEVIKTVAHHLSGIKRPKEWIILNEFPKTNNGKVDRLKLKQLAMEKK